MTPPRRPAPGGRRRSPRAEAVPHRTRSRRVRLMAALALVAFVGLGSRAIYLGTVQAEDLSNRATDVNRVSVDLIAERGDIRSSDGRVLATDNLLVDVTATPRNVDDPATTARDLAAVLDLDPAEVQAKLEGDGVYAVVARSVPITKADAAKRLGLRGVEFTDTYERLFPGGPLAAQLLGFTDVDHKGQLALEAQLDEPLTGTPGRRVRVRDRFDRTLRVPADQDPVPGEDVTLAINAAIQERTERVLLDARKTYGAKRAMAVVMDPRDGRVLTMASVPRFDPNDRATLNMDLTRNRPVVDMFEPGSTFKIVTMAGALEDGDVTPSTSFFLPARLTLYDRTIKDSHRDYDTTMTASQILQQSSNVGTVEIAKRLGEDRLIEWMKAFGFGSATGIDFPGESPGYIRPREEWYGVGIGNVPIGQGVSVTLTQLVQSYAVIANGGTLVQPHLVQQVGERTVTPPSGRRVISPETAAKVDAMLRDVVSADGTGSLAEVRGYQVAGKTGTAEKWDDTIGSYSKSRYVASFVGYLPADDPQLVIAVVVDEPNASIYGGEVAAPPFVQIAEWSINVLGIEP